MRDGPVGFSFQRNAGKETQTLISLPRIPIGNPASILRVLEGGQGAKYSLQRAPKELLNPWGAISLTQGEGVCVYLGRGQKAERSFIQFVTHLSEGHWPKGREVYAAVDGAASCRPSDWRWPGRGTRHQRVQSPGYKPLTHPLPVPHW